MTEPLEVSTRLMLRSLGWTEDGDGCWVHPIEKGPRFTFEEAAAEAARDVAQATKVAKAYAAS